MCGKVRGKVKQCSENICFVSAPSPHFHMGITQDSVTCSFLSPANDSSNHSDINLASKHRVFIMTASVDI